MIGGVYALIDGGLKQELPCIGQIDCGGYLLYAGRVNEIHGEPGAGKSNIAIAIAKGLIDRGRTVLFIDPEDNLNGIGGRFLSFGTDRHQLLHELKYLHDPDPEEILKAARWVKANPVDLVILDGLAEMLAAQGLSESEPADILPFFRRYVRPFTDAGAAVLITDHVTKDGESRGRWSRGSGAKLGRYDGAVFELKVRQPYSPGQPGSVILKVAKDRCGGVGPVGKTIAEISFAPGGNEGETLVSVQQVSEDTFLPTALMEKVVKYLKQHPDAGKRDLRRLGRAQYVDAAIDALIQQKKLREIPGGSGKSTKFELLNDE